MLNNAVNCSGYIPLVVGELITMEHGGNDIIRGNTKYRETNPFHRHPSGA